MHLLGTNITTSAHGVPMTVSGGLCPLHRAAQEGHLEAVRLLAADPNATAAKGATALYVAAFQGHLKVAQMLVEVGGALDQATADGATPLMVAAHQGHLEMVQFLIQAGAGKDQARAGSSGIGNTA